MIRAKDDTKYEIEMHIDTNAPIDFRQCYIAFNETECLQSYIEIIKSNTVLKINKSLLPASVIKLGFRTVISGCNANNRLRDIDMADSLPILYHNSDHDCIYRIKNAGNMLTSMMSVTVNKFPSQYATQCKASVQISSSDKSETSLDKTLAQASFDSLDSLMPFGQGVFISRKYLYVKLVNCYENSEPIEIKIQLIKSECPFFKLFIEMFPYQS